MKKPTIDATTFIADGAVVLGEVTLAKDSSVWYNATVRGDRGSITIGEGSNIRRKSREHKEKTDRTDKRNKTGICKCGNAICYSKISSVGR